ncbi:DUF3667 domain-containing protein [Myroides odoratimimus]|uniref:DUF3667 domain-containing protein n=1 Tax=Myroides odoratimimus TaxID=76832 RepID=UPI002DC0525D|nr:DUF3667 domain-containing protein [Myroides odoratimimus]MEC4054383.1 DUF3667 domain-containing protein [Myroides odoratimimus]
MDDHCTNCNHIVTQNFCSNCGQKKYSRLNKNYLLEELYEVVVYTNKGFLYSLKKVVSNPGKTAREFIDGKRVNHYKPILLSFVLSGISTLISFQLIGLGKPLANLNSKNPESNKIMSEFLAYFTNYNSFIMLLCIPFFALLTKLTFRKWGHNYYEHLVMNAYILSFITILNTVIVYPITYFYITDPDAVYNILGLSLLTTPFVLYWFFREFYREHSSKRIFIKILQLSGWVVLSYIALFILATLIAIIISIIRTPNIVT